MMMRTRCFFRLSSTARSPPLSLPAPQPAIAGPPDTKAGNRRATPIPGPPASRVGAADARRRSRSLLQEKLHLHAGKLDHVVVVQAMRLGVERLPVHHREVRAFDV